MLTLAKSFQIKPAFTVSHELSNIHTWIAHEMSHCRREVKIFWHQLENAFFKQANIINNIKNFCLGSHHARLKIMIEDPNSLAQNLSVFIPIAQRLTSRVSIHVMDKSYHEETANFIIFDGKTAIYRKSIQAINCVLVKESHSEIATLNHYFNKAWDLSRPAAELRALSI